MTKEEAKSFFETFYRGAHHFPGKLQEFGSGWSMIHTNEIGTFDFNEISRLFVMAHDMCVRVGIHPYGMNRMKITIHKRSRTGNMCERHTTLEEHVADIRKHLLQTAPGNDPGNL